MNEYAALLGRSRIRQRLLTLLIDNPRGRLHLRELARLAETSAGTAARELGRLTAAGIATREAEGSQVYYRAATDSPLYPAVRDLVRRTIGAGSVLRRELESLPGVESAVIVGSYAAGTMQPGSDIDILVVGNPDRDELTDRLERASRTIGRAVNETVMTRAELDTRRARGNGFVASIDSGPTIDILE